MHCQNGDIIPFSLERTLAHEFQHAAQPGLLENAQDYLQRRQELHNEYISEICSVIPFEDYRHRVEAIREDPAALRELFGEIYDTHVEKPMKEGFDRLRERISQDEICHKFIAKYETPAIEFENLMMGKYHGEAGRILDYLNSGYLGEEAWTMERQEFIDSAMTSFAESARERASGSKDGSQHSPG